MVKNKTLTLSIVIPAYNEENHLRACLEAIKRQTVPPDEVIVVDNNSTDKTARIAKKYAFVTLLKEPQQGVVFARDRGFNAATSDIIGRINADSMLAEDWAERVKEDFQKNTRLVAVTGPSISLSLPPFRGRSTLWSLIYYVWTDTYFRVPILWGANMAIRRRFWQKIRRESIHDSYTHEDQDISVAIAKYGGLVLRDNKLLIHADYASFHHWLKFKSYMLRRWYTKSKHQPDYDEDLIPLLSHWRAVLIYPLIIIPGLLFVLSSWAVYHAAKIYRRLKD